MKNIIIPQKYRLIINKISDAAKETNFDVYIVGGFVRDLLIGRESEDLDIMVSSKLCDKNERLSGINFSKFLANKYKLRNPINFEKFGTSKLFIDGKEVEFIMPRREYYFENSRNPRTYLASLKQDALRRDFTINALFLRLSDMKILDFTLNGINDIKNKTIRVTDIKNCEIIFKQDPLRILRAIRQSLQLNFTIENKTYDAMKISAMHIKIISSERIKNEINKILIENTPSKAFRMMNEINILTKIFPEITKLNTSLRQYEYRTKDLFTNTMIILDKVTNNLILRMSALLFNIGKHSIIHKSVDTTKIEIILKRLTYSKKFIQQITSIIKNSIYFSIYYSSSWTDTDVRKFVEKCDNELDLIMEFLKIYSNNNKTCIKFVEFKKRIKCLKSKNMLYVKSELLTGIEITNMFNIPPGKLIKKIKNKIKEMQFQNPDLTKAKAIKIIKKNINTIIKNYR
ncbi:MAG: hypothetical protein LBJ68_00725 [Endomicrobium sp.]|jgi:tRNA nucleotidyltransferase/poly(A) polymerase|nr:hypothetical protein [Endomicrobium sp.]